MLGDTTFHPTDGDPVSFIGATVRAGSEVLGAIIVELPTSTVTDLVTVNEGWERLGLGDTGGGERLLKLKEHWPQKVVVTEEYPPNFKLVTERLAPLGVIVNAIATEANASRPAAATSGRLNSLRDGTQDGINSVIQTMLNHLVAMSMRQDPKKLL